MTILPKMPYIDLTKSLNRVISAHEAVIEGIATHVQKEHAKREDAYAKAEAEAKLKVRQGT